ncbi:MAG: XrtA system polysaccharide deacetylase [Candidatus Scalindua sp.]
MSDIRNALTVDVEDYYQVSAFENHIPRDKWDKYPTRIEKNIEKILSLFSEYNISATFFVLGWIAERNPEIVRRIAESGHEIASHGYSHVRITQQTPKEFQEDIVKTKNILENICGIQVKGYRAASFSIDSENHWAHAELEQAEYQYSSSIYPVRHDLYGIPDAPRFPYKPVGRNLYEIPISTIQWMKHRIPCGGGGYFRLYPYLFSRFMISHVNNKESMPCIFYFHPWELDVNQPRQEGLNIKTRTRHYLNLNRMESRIKRLLCDFRWDRMDNIFDRNNLDK